MDTTEPFVTGDDGSNSCPEGSLTIAAESDCQAAANALGAHYNGDQGLGSTVPGTCVCVCVCACVRVCVRARVRGPSAAKVELFPSANE
eukprot:COSAG03_NODE_18695_length_350_cov_0.780876_1_plen_88_part_10